MKAASSDTSIPVMDGKRSLTHLHVPAFIPVATEVAAYQKRRIKKLKKLGRA